MKHVKKLPEALAHDIGAAAAQWYTEEVESASSIGAMLLIALSIQLGKLTSVHG